MLQQWLQLNTQTRQAQRQEQEQLQLLQHYQRLGLQHGQQVQGLVQEQVRQQQQPQVQWPPLLHLTSLPWLAQQRLQLQQLAEQQEQQRLQVWARWGSVCISV